MSEPSKKKTVLVVDDDDAIRILITHLLEREGFAVRNAINGMDALEYLKKNPTGPSLILLDLRMPVLDGWQFRTIQLADPTWSKIPVIVITSLKTVENDIVSIKAAGYCHKPLQVDLLVQMVHQHIK
jgi:CheY-like chemotaxis protein